MQVPRYRTAYTPFASLLLWSIWICHCVKLALSGSSLFFSPQLSRSRYFVALCLSISFCPSFSLASRTLRSLFKVPFCSSLCALSPYHPHFLSANLRCSTEKSKSPLAAARTGLQKRAWRDKKDAGWSAYESPRISFPIAVNVSQSISMHLFIS